MILYQLELHFRHNNISFLFITTEKGLFYYIYLVIHFGPLKCHHDLNVTHFISLNIFAFCNELGMTTFRQRKYPMVLYLS